ncbi:uncharacterized protein B0H18DRAFT_1033949 [Fomitopsis serialis]|uniref:uncharacterized protein n=1 Tax=Fomitopsis serialis TaxID=139415 RepID=UPI0020082023|nr:uncharacterized protein B0H18DRAFT_1033949 [Neoantrodia serialis]KAH9917612.1 hypothetical protein B0H18DRAFT_1033949 [Neoantrodia serialis]
MRNADESPREYGNVLRFSHEQLGAIHHPSARGQRLQRPPTPAGTRLLKSSQRHLVSATRLLSKHQAIRNSAPQAVQPAPSQQGRQALGHGSGRPGNTQHRRLPCVLGLPDDVGELIGQRAILLFLLLRVELVHTRLAEEGQPIVLREAQDLRVLNKVCLAGVAVAVLPELQGDVEGVIHGDASGADGGVLLALFEERGPGSECPMRYMCIELDEVDEEFDAMLHRRQARSYLLGSGVRTSVLRPALQCTDSPFT